MRIYKKYILTMGMVWTACLVLFVLAYFFVIAPQLKSKEELIKQSAEKQQLYETAIAAANEENRKKLADEVGNMKSKLGEYITEFEDFANLTFAISRIATDKQVGSFTIKTADQVRDSDQLESKNLQENGIGIAFDSDFRQFASILNALERHSPVIFVDRFKVSRGAQDGTAARVDMDLSVFVRKRTQG